MPSTVAVSLSKRPPDVSRAVSSSGLPSESNATGGEGGSVTAGNSIRKRRTYTTDEGELLHKTGDSSRGPDVSHGEKEEEQEQSHQLHASVCQKPITLIARKFSYSVRLGNPCIPRDCCRGGGRGVKEKRKTAGSLGSFPTVPSQLISPEGVQNGQQASSDGSGVGAKEKQAKAGEGGEQAPRGEKKEEQPSEDLEAGRRRGGDDDEGRTFQKEGDEVGLSGEAKLHTRERAQPGEQRDGEGQVKAILSDIDLYAKPGEMLVIMGPSGSGKTTLLNALAGRSLPSSRVVQNGDILYLGLPPGETLSNISTYVMQKDKVPELLTVIEYITFFSKLKMKDSTNEERAARVEVVLKELGLWRSRHTRVGGSAQKGLSGGEIKRLALAVELLHDPSLIFLDEPTSGLDAALAFETMKLLLRLARQGRRTIVCTIHQPRSQLFAMFDRLILMFEGRIVYQGPARRCVSYFARRGFHCPPQFNPADFILDLLTVTNISAGAPLACPQSDASLDAQSQLEAELEQIHHEEQKHSREVDGESVGVDRQRSEPPVSEGVDGKGAKAHSSAPSYDARLGHSEDNKAEGEDNNQRGRIAEMGKKEGKGMHVGDQDDATSLLTAPEPSSSANTRDKHSASAGEGGGRRLWVDIPYGDVHAAGYTDMEGGSIRDGDGGLSSSFSSQHTTTRGGRGDHPHHHHSSRQRGGRGGNVSGGEDGGDLSSISAVRQASSVGERKGSGSAVEMRKAVSVLSVASSLATEGLFHTNDRHRKRATGEVGESLGGGGVEDHPQTGQAEGGAFLDAEEQGEIHRVLVAEEDVRALVDSYAESDDRRDVKGVIESTLNEAFGDEGKDGGKGRKGRNANQMQLARRIGAGAGRLLPRRRRWSDWGREVSVLIQINFLNLFRNPMSTLVQLGLNIFLGVMFGIIFFNVQKRDETFETARNTFGCLFFLAAQFVFGPLDCLVLFSEDRELFNRDTANGNYSPSAYFVAKSLANLPFQHIPITCYAIISFFMCGLYLDVAKFFIFLAIGQLTIFASTSFLFCVSAGSPRIAVAQAIAPMVLLVFLLVGGFYSRSEDIPAVIRWVKYISPIYYSYASLALNQFDPSGTWGDTSNKTLLTTYGGLTETEMGFSIGMLTLLGCVLRFLSFLFLKYTNRRIGLEA